MSSHSYTSAPSVEASTTAPRAARAAVPAAAMWYVPFEGTATNRPPSGASVVDQAWGGSGTDVITVPSVTRWRTAADLLDIESGTVCTHTSSAAGPGWTAPRLSGTGLPPEAGRYSFIPLPSVSTTPPARARITLSPCPASKATLVTEPSGATVMRSPVPVVRYSEEPPRSGGSTKV